ncbi:MAG: hypothetical protein K6F95_02770 [Selenomonas sp.]|uniref:hypothetical protein n=1 Tax=Selenomonas sp. TaxID=2053611 RepID=UPI0025E48FCB|nr:hypothetical protein [Selenomonas sp.]MCR5756812.1 hypothetical protein [Selenomonas sp.]
MQEKGGIGVKKKFVPLLAGLMTMASAVCYATVPTDAVAISGVAPGDSLESAKAKLGMPSQVGDKFHFPNGIIVEVFDHNPNKVEEITAKTSQAGITPGGLKVGMEEAVIIRTYGNPDKLDKDRDETEYTYYSADNMMEMEFKVVKGTIVKIKCEYR